MIKVPTTINCQGLRPIHIPPLPPRRKTRRQVPSTEPISRILAIIQGEDLLVDLSISFQSWSHARTFHLIRYNLEAPISFVCTYMVYILSGSCQPIRNHLIKYLKLKEPMKNFHGTLEYRPTNRGIHVSLEVRAYYIYTRSMSKSSFPFFTSLQYPLIMIGYTLYH